MKLPSVYEYLKKPSRYWTKYKYYEVNRNNKKVKMENSNYPEMQSRPFSDLLVSTSYAYFLPCFYAIYTDEYIFALLCFITGLSSTLYHLNSEQLFFNMDNIFATSLSFIYLWSLYLAYQFTSILTQNHLQEIEENDSIIINNITYIYLYLILGLFGIPLAAYLLVSCGMPGEIVILPNCQQCYRCRPNQYKFTHSIWHLLSAGGLLTTVWFFNQYHLYYINHHHNHHHHHINILYSNNNNINNNNDLWYFHSLFRNLIYNHIHTLFDYYNNDNNNNNYNNSNNNSNNSNNMVLGSYCSLDGYGYLPVVPMFALFLSTLINIWGNVKGIMPLE